tara:strand:+ start:98 stop:454 length:357 start_codon:yes stop_codon:yes gene_type:complete
MAHFAQIDANNVVLQVIVVNDSELLDDKNVEQETLGQSFCQGLLGGSWVQTSYNGAIRKNFAGIGGSYDSTRDAFISPQPYASWVLDEETCRWEAPIAHPDDGLGYIWDENTTSWVAQ